MAHDHARVRDGPSPEAERGSGVYDEKLGMWIFLLGNHVLHGADRLYIILASPIRTPAAPGKVLNIPVTAVNTSADLQQREHGEGVRQPRTETRRSCGSGWC
jgi:hypothetical protein